MIPSNNNSNSSVSIPARLDQLDKQMDNLKEQIAKVKSNSRLSAAERNSKIGKLKAKLNQAYDEYAAEEEKISSVASNSLYDLVLDVATVAAYPMTVAMRFAENHPVFAAGLVLGSSVLSAIAAPITEGQQLNATRETLAKNVVKRAAPQTPEFEKAEKWCKGNPENQLGCVQKMLNVVHKPSAGNESVSSANQYFSNHFANNTGALLNEAQNKHKEWTAVVKELEQVKANGTLSPTVVEPLTQNNRTLASVLKFCPSATDSSTSNTTTSASPTLFANTTSAVNATASGTGTINVTDTASGTDTNNATSRLIHEKAKCARNFVELPTNRTEAAAYLKLDVDNFINQVQRRERAWNRTVSHLSKKLKEQLVTQKPTMASTVTSTKSSKIARPTPKPELDICGRPLVRDANYASEQEESLDLEALKGTMEAGYDVPYQHGTKAGYSNPNWMAGVHNDVNLAGMSIPGTHNSLSMYGGDSVRTQSLNTTEQLKMGNRYFDTRFSYSRSSGRLEAYHGVVYQHDNLDNFLGHVTKFLTENPTETVVVRVRNEAGHRANAERFYEGFKETVCKYKEHYATPKGDNPKLGSIRGKFIVIPYFETYSSRVGLDTKRLTVQDNYYLRHNWALHGKWKAAKQHFENKPANKISINYLSGSGGVFPYFVASGRASPGGDQLWTGGIARRGEVYKDFVRRHCLIRLCSIYFKGTNLMLEEMAKAGNHDDPLGIVAMDFPGGSVVDTIIQHNRRDVRYILKKVKVDDKNKLKHKE